MKKIALFRRVLAAAFILALAGGLYAAPSEAMTLNVLSGFTEDVGVAVAYYDTARQTWVNEGWIMAHPGDGKYEIENADEERGLLFYAMQRDGTRIIDEDAGEGAEGWIDRGGNFEFKQIPKSNKPDGEKVEWVSWQRAVMGNFWATVRLAPDAADDKADDETPGESGGDAELDGTSTVPDMGMGMRYPMSAFTQFSNNEATSFVLITTDGTSPKDASATVTVSAGRTPDLTQTGQGIRMELADSFLENLQRLTREGSLSKLAFETERYIERDNGSLIFVRDASYTGENGQERKWYSMTSVWFNEFSEGRKPFTWHLILDCDAEAADKYIPLVARMEASMFDYDPVEGKE